MIFLELNKQMGPTLHLLEKKIYSSKMVWIYVSTLIYFYKDNKNFHIFL